MKDSVKLRKVSTQLDPKLVAYMAPDGWLDVRRTRDVFYAAGIINPTDDADLFDAIVKHTKLLLEFIKTSGQSASEQIQAADQTVQLNAGQPMRKLVTKKS